MGNYLKKFSSYADYLAYRATDGWYYPAVNMVSDEVEKQIHYNNEIRMRWYDADTAKVPSFSGDVSIDQFKAWVDAASLPCEIKKDKTDFAYLKRGTGTAISDWTLRNDGNASHYNTDDKASYLQMTEIQNINVGLFQDSAAGWKEVRFNFDSGCPKGFHKWFAHPYWNSSLTNPITKQAGVWTKLIGRYDTTPVTTATDTASGINIMYGGNQGSTWDTDSMNWGASRLYPAIKATNSDLLEETYWEHLVLSYIFSAYFKTFNHQSIYGGLQDSYSTNSTTWTNGQTDSLMTHYGQLGSNMGYRFMHIENAIHGKQWIWGAGWLGDGTTGKYWMTYDDIKANAALNLDKSNADIIGTYANSWSGSWITNIDLWGVPTSVGSSSSTGFYDGCWSSPYATRCAYLGGTSSDGSLDGGFARSFYADTGYVGWGWRGRSTMNR